MVDEIQAGAHVLLAVSDPLARTRPAAENQASGGRPRNASPHDARVEVRTQFEPGSRRLFTDILDPATREVLYRVPPQSVTDAVVRLSEATSRYERLLSGAAWQVAQS